MSQTPLRRVLIANRGEIAVRIARAASELGVETVAVYSAADADSLHTRVADRAVELPGPPVAAYLDIDVVVEVALAEGCDALHPGYGFLSESPALARAATAAGLVFVGPSADALTLFGDKAAARALATERGIPIVPGSDGVVADLETAEEAAAAIGFPVMIKAAAGGGGRGMRRVDEPGAFAGAFDAAGREAAAAFGDGALLVEKLVVDPRHIEVQVIGDATGRVVHLWERDCSIQQRNQKVIEVAPAPNLDRDLRERVLADAVRLAGAGGLTSAGTVEFVVDPTRGSHWFIEANPRIQVEHTVTEEVTGIDLVQTQLRLAAGESLDALGLGSQESVPPVRGAAVQVRVALTSAGTITNIFSQRCTEP